MSTISRILATLVGGGLVDHVAATGRYRLGAGMLRLTSAAGLYYYLRVVVYVYMVPEAKLDAIQGGQLLSAGLAIAGCAIIVIWMGVQPGMFAALTQGAGPGAKPAKRRCTRRCPKSARRSCNQGRRSDRSAATRTRLWQVVQ